MSLPTAPGVEEYRPESNKDVTLTLKLVSSVSLIIPSDASGVEESRLTFLLLKTHEQQKYLTLTSTTTAVDTKSRESGK